MLSLEMLHAEVEIRRHFLRHRIAKGNLHYLAAHQYSYLTSINLLLKYYTYSLLTYWITKLINIISELKYLETPIYFLKKLTCNLGLYRCEFYIIYTLNDKSKWWRILSSSLQFDKLTMVLMLRYAKHIIMILWYRNKLSFIQFHRWTVA